MSDEKRVRDRADELAEEMIRRFGAGDLYTPVGHRSFETIAAETIRKAMAEQRTWAVALCMSRAGTFLEYAKKFERAGEAAAHEDMMKRFNEVVALAELIRRDDQTPPACDPSKENA